MFQRFYIYISDDNFDKYFARYNMLYKYFDLVYYFPCNLSYFRLKFIILLR